MGRMLGTVYRAIASHLIKIAGLTRDTTPTSISFAVAHCTRFIIAFKSALVAQRLCENSPNFVADGTALHIGYKGVSDEILIAHTGIRELREPVRFTTGYCRFAFSHSLGRKQTSVTLRSRLRIMCAFNPYPSFASVKSTSALGCTNLCCPLVKVGHQFGKLIFYH